MNISKTDIAWIVIRLIGIYFAVEAISSAVQIGLESYALERANEAVSRGIDAEKYLTQMYRTMLTQTLNLILYATISFYCLRKGKLVFKLLMYTNNENKT